MSKDVIETFPACVSQTGVSVALYFEVNTMLTPVGSAPTGSWLKKQA